MPSAAGDAGESITNRRCSTGLLATTAARDQHVSGLRLSAVEAPASHLTIVGQHGHRDGGMLCGHVGPQLGVDV